VPLDISLPETSAPPGCTVRAAHVFECRLIHPGTGIPIAWEATQNGNVKILNDTADFYRFFDATPHAEFLYGCVRLTDDEVAQIETLYATSFGRP
jgi:hypothetical protein